ncbi:sensor domain-containing protein [Mycobacterium paraffinicum]|uniref:PknH-like extracellular domain-containing protein n=1 Tax=Mycobacterium paraffinicum TaxID=53378 RepID=A0ABP8R9P5_9MYCO|nr:sensor domain-containing protein [Mycobacterium paraffinicum]MCV7311612.1 sensor domain-containing protein [Mycobacterium paraffinicum]
MSAVSLRHQAGPISGAADQGPAGRRPGVVRVVRWVILAAVTLTLLVSGCTATSTGHPAAAPDLGRWQPPVILPQHLADLLLKEDDVNTIAHTTGMAVRKPVTRMWHDEEMVTNPGCVDTYSPAEATAYQGTNWTALQGQILDDATPAAREHALMQVLVGFRDADSAQQFFSKSKARWSGCANRSITITPPGHTPTTWDLGELQATDTSLAILQTQPSGRGPICQRAMGLVNNVVIDTLWCGFDTTSQASDIVSKTTATISQA